MKPLSLAGAAAAALLGAAPPAHAQFIYQLEKAQDYYQTSASGATLDPNAGATFNYSSPYASTLTTPLQTTVTPPASGGVYQESQVFPTLAGMNAAYPDGNYIIHVQGLGPVTLPLNGGAYPVTPEITSGSAGTWLPGGVLLLDPTVANTLNLSNFSGYGTQGVASAMQLSFYDLNGNQASYLSELVATEPIFIGARVLTSPLLTFTIAKGDMTAGHLYEFVMSYLSLTDVDTTSIATYDIFGYYDKTTVLFVMAQTGTTAQAAAPTISSQPANQVATPGASVTLDFPGSFPTGGVAGAGASWYFIDNHGNGPIPPSKDSPANTATDARLTISPVAASDAGSYYILAVGPGGFLESQEVTLTVDTAPPTLTILPVGQAMNPGSTLVLTAGAPGATSYQWFLNGKPISVSASDATTNVVTDANGSQLVISNLTSQGAGSYTVEAVNSNGSGPSSPPAVVSVATAASPGSMGSSSVRALVGANDRTLVGGFSVAGSTSRTVLIQALGPALLPPPYSVGAPLANPVLSVHQTQNGKDVVLYANTGWGSGRVLLASAAKLPALPVLQPGSADSELLLTLPPGSYTAQVSSADGTGTGVALCAIYQLP
jgi:hypothetical protein